uniref:Uncharacterized protein n=1 Tax=Triticum urartu TaxID=4572 RepID=A0A8R7PYB9_TRIUA
AHTATATDPRQEGLHRCLRLTSPRPVASRAGDEARRGEPGDMERHGAAAVAVRLRRRLRLLVGLRLRLLQLRRLLVLPPLTLLLISFPANATSFFLL